MKKELLILFFIFVSLSAFAACPGPGEKVTVDDLGFKLHGAQGACSNDYTAQYELKVDMREVLSDALYTFSFTDGTSPTEYTASQLKGNGGIIEHTFTKPSCDMPNGYFTAKVEVTCNSKYYGSASIENVKVLLPPQAKFSAKSSVCVNEIITFNNQSIKGLDWDCEEVVYSQWDFGDGTTSTTHSPAHSYKSSGKYTVVLTVNTDDDIDCTFDKYTMDITVVDLPVINNITPDPVEVCAGKKSGDVTVDGTDIAYIQWEGGSSAGLTDEIYSKQNKKIPSFTAKNTGTTVTETTVTVIPFNSLGCQGEPKTFKIRVKPAPSINKINDVAACVGENVGGITFSSPISGTTFSWKSDKDIGFGLSGNGNIQSFTATNNSNIPVTATVSVTASNSDPALKECGDITESFNVTVTPIPAPTSITGINPTKCGTPDGKIILSGVAANTSYSISYNGKSASSYKSGADGKITLSSLTPGTYSNITASLNNCKYEYAESITLTSPAAPPTPTITLSKSEICEGESVKLSANAESGVAYSWKGPNGWSSTEASPSLSSLTKASAGEYSLVVSKNNCNSGAGTATLIVNKDPEVSFSKDFSDVCIGTEVKLGENVIYDWNTIEGSKRDITWTITPDTYSFVSGTAKDSIPTVKFNDKGTYSIKVAVASIGCSGSKLEATKNISVFDSSYDLIVTADKDGGCVPFTVKFTNSTDDNAVDSYTWSVDRASGWSFEQGSDTDSKSPAIKFTEPADYKVTVTAHNSCGDKPKTFEIGSHKELSLDLAGVSGVCGKYTYITTDKLTINGDESDIKAGSVKWTISPTDGVSFKQGSETDLRPTIQFDKHGTYSVALEMESYCGKVSKSCTVAIDEPIDEIKISDIAELCANIPSEQDKNPVTLSATPADGTWSSYTKPEWIDGDKLYPNAPGSLFATYTIVRGSCTAKDSVEIKIKDYPPLDMGENINVCLNDNTPIKLTASPDGGVWSGDNVSQKDGAYWYTPPLQIGTVTLNYIVADKVSGCKSEGSKEATVQGLPSPEFGPEHFCLPGETIFEPEADKGNKFIFDYGDGGSDETGRHLYADIGVYDVKLTVIAGTGCKDSLTQKLLVEQAPSPYFDIDPDSGCSPLDVTITPSVKTSDPDVLFHWDFGTKGTFDGLEPGTVTFTATSYDSVYVIRFDVENVCGSSYHSDTVSVLATAGAAFDTEQKWFCSPVEVYFQNKTLGSMEGISYKWDFDDGETSDERFPSHIFRTDFFTTKTFNVKLVATNKCGADSTYSKVLVKPQTIKSQFSNPDNYNCQNTEICFDNNSVGVSEEDPITGCVWDFGNGHSSVEWDGCTVYPDTGTYVVNLTVFNGCGQDKYASQVHISPGPQLKLSAPDFICQWDTIAPVFQSSEPVSATMWEFGDGTTSLLREPKHQYTESGVHMITLNVTADNIAECPATDSLEIKVQEEPHPIIEPLEYQGCSPLEYSPSFTGTYYIYTDYLGNGQYESLPYHTYINTESEPLRYTTTMKIEDVYGCKSEQKGFVVVFPEPKALFEKKIIKQGKPEEVLFVNLSKGADGCKWTLPFRGDVFTCDSVVESFDDNLKREIALYVENRYKCADSLIMTHKPLMKGLYFPNTFAPNSDIPEVKTFNGFGIGIVQYTLEIFDLYGNMVFKTSALDIYGSPSEGWDGNDLNGNPLPQDVYSWKASAKFEDGTVFPYGNSTGQVTEYRGSVLLLRK